MILVWKDVTFVNAYHGTEYNNLVEKMENKYVLICDFSFKKDLFDQMIIRGNAYTWKYFNIRPS